MSGSVQEPAILLVDDEEAWLYSFSVTLRAAGLPHILTCSDSRKVMSMLADHAVSVVVLDLTMPHVSGQELLPEILAEYPAIPVIIVTGINDVSSAVASVKAGAFDYFVKSTEPDRLTSGIRRAVELWQLKREHDRLRERLLRDELEHPEAFAGIVTVSDQVLGIFRYLEAVSISAEPVLITGETGVGKELFAKAVHAVSSRSGEFVPVNAAGLDDHVFSDTLFGHQRGAFTGADSARGGLVEAARGGTLFLDEIGDLALNSQVKLLRLIQEQEYYPLGSDVARRSDIRVVVATNQNLKDATANGTFRKDLYYRLATHRVDIPPLRSRKEDIPPLLDHFLEDAARQLGRTAPSYPRELPLLLRSYSFPGNVRELRSMVYEALTRHKAGILSMDSFKEHMQAYSSIPDNLNLRDENHKIAFGDPLPSLKEASAQLIDEALERAGGNQSIAAQMLGISRQALNKRLNQQ